MADELIIYSNNYRYLPELLAELNRHNPRQYARFIQPELSLDNYWVLVYILKISVTLRTNNNKLVTDRGVDSDTVEAIRACGPQVIVAS
jgi:hypothetical protein